MQEPFSKYIQQTCWRLRTTLSFNVDRKKSFSRLHISGSPNALVVLCTLSLDNLTSFTGNVTICLHEDRIGSERCERKARANKRGIQDVFTAQTKTV